jgi:hypothetical protein
VSTPFLLDERNRPFVQGLSARPPANNSGIAMGCIVLFLIPFVLAGLFILVFTVSTWATWLSFSSNARPAIGLVTGKEIDDDGEDTTYYVEYSYSASGDRTFSGRASVNHESYNQLAKGEQIAVEYLANNQSSSRLAGENHIAMPLFLTAFSLIWNGFIGVVFTAIIGGARKARRLRAEGQLRPAEIISYKAELDSDDDLMVSLEYRLITPEGRAILGKDRGTRNLLKGKPEPVCPAPAAALYIDEKIHELL